MQNLGVTPSEYIEVCLGLFCYENFYFDKIRSKEFERDFNVKFENIEKINIKEDLIIKLKDGNIIHIPLDKLNDYMRPACKACGDFTNIYADISFGGLGSQDKYTTVIYRTEKGKKIINEAINAGIIKCLELDSSEKANMKEIITQFTQSKIRRNEEFMKDLK